MTRADEIYQEALAAAKNAGDGRDQYIIGWLAMKAATLEKDLSAARSFGGIMNERAKDAAMVLTGR